MRRPYEHPHPLYSINDPNQYSRKRQRRQAASVVVQSFWSNNHAAMGRKSTAQPRPELLVPPKGIGPIREPNENDVLSGRGGRINSHPGNIQFRDMVNERKKEYLAKTTKKLEKAHIAAKIVREIRSMDPPGRFLKEEASDGLWYDIGDQKAIKKAGQALREDAPDIRPEIDGESSGEDKDSPDKVKKEKKTSPKSQGKKKAPQKSPPDQHIPAGGTGASAQDIAAQASMPPPYSQAQVQSFPIQRPAEQNNAYALPQRLFAGVASGARSVSGKAGSVSRHAFEALQQPAYFGQAPPIQPPPEDIAFGQRFYPPPGGSGQSDLTNNTMSTISGISDPMSSAIYGSSFGSGSASSGRQSMMNESLRLSQMQHRGQRMSDIGGSLRSMGSLTRSLSFPDMSSIVDHDSFKAIMEGDEVMSSGSSNKVSVGSRNSDFGMESRNRANSNMSMSIASMSIGSTTSSQWMAGMGLHGADDGRSMLSEMSSDLHALDLADNRKSYLNC